MVRQKVAEGRSSQIRSIGYLLETQELEIEFSSGGVYRYSGVPQDVYDTFIKADSLGMFVGTRIRGMYSFKRLHSDGLTYDAKCEDAACWCARVTKTSRETEKPDEKEKPKKASKKPKKIS
jgi:hypothetical protein